MAAHIMQREMTLARRGITTPGSRYRTNGPKKRLQISRSVSHGQDRAKHQAAMIRKTVVGSPGTTTPTAPMPTLHTPAPTSP